MVVSKVLFFLLASIDFACSDVTQVCGKNQVYSECENNNCQSSCANPTFLWACKGPCVPGCICADDYLKNSKGECVRPEDCDCADKNAIYSLCSNYPCINTCRDPSRSIRCKSPPGCYPGCICKDDFLKDENGTCLPRSACRKYVCKKFNEIFSDCHPHPKCQNTCDQPDLISSCKNPGCHSGCSCRPGYLRNHNNQCVEPKHCKCGKNQEYSECENHGCQNTCEYPQFSMICSPRCVPGCICKGGYLRTFRGVCVLPENCEPPTCINENEKFVKCVSCETCATLGQNVTCNNSPCKPGCQCEPGYFRNSQNMCVLLQFCDCKENEEFDLCFDPCPPRTCDAIGKNITCVPIDPAKCKPRCKCEFNYRRDKNNICIPIQNCPPLTCTGTNETYNPCPDACLEENCTNLHNRLTCKPVKQECKPSCVCIDGYLRNSNGVCIPATQCGCLDPNEEVVTCPNPCQGGTCKLPEFNRCSAPCKRYGCQCTRGYVRDTNGACVLLSQCPKE